MASSGTGNHAQVHFKKGSCLIVLKKGDLIDDNADVVVIPSPHRQDHRENFLIFKKVYAAANFEFKKRIDDALRDLDRGKGHFISNRQRHYILSPPPFLKHKETAQKLLGQLYTTCLTLANEKNMESIAFPTIGCGVIGFKAEEVAEIVHRSLENFDHNKCKSLQEIRIVIFQQNDYDAFADVFIKLSEGKNAKIKFHQISEENNSSSNMGGGDSRKAKKDVKNPDGNADYEDDFESDEKNDKKSGNQKSNLDPNAPNFVPKSNPREIRLKNKKTELSFLYGNLLKTKVDAIVDVERDEHNPIAKEAGRDFADIYKEFKGKSNNKNIHVGHSRILPSCDLKPISYIIKTAPPSSDSTDPQRVTQELQLCYQTSLTLANLYDLKTIAFPPIHCDVHDKTTDVAIQVALKTINDHAESLSKVLIICSSETPDDKENTKSSKASK